MIEGAAEARAASRACSTSCRRRQLNTYASSQKLQEIGKNYEPKVPYPATGLANRLKLCAQLIDAGIGARIFYVSIDGFDTHANQGGPQGPTPTCSREVSGGDHRVLQGPRRPRAQGPAAAS